MTYTITRNIIASRDPRLKRHVNHDSRSRQYAFRAPRSATYGNVLWPRSIPILDQGDLGSCTGNAATGHLGSGAFFATLPTSFHGDENQAKTLYSKATALDSYAGTYPPTDTGSDGLSVAKAAQAFGFISGYRHTFAFADFMAAVQQQPVIVGVNWYEGFYDPDANGVINLAAGDQVAGGHEFVVRGYDADKAQLLADNSWGPGWAVAGSFRIPTAVMTRLLSEDGDCTMFTPLTEPAPVPTPVPPTPGPTPPGPVPAADAALLGAGNAWEKSVLSKISKAGKMRSAFDGWKKANGYSL
jgi:hypothetical protein